METKNEIVKQKTIILLNGPVDTGKFKIASILQTFYNFSHYSIWGEFRSRVHSLYGLHNIPEDYFMTHYDKKTPLFNGLSPSQAYRKVLREYVIPNHGYSFLMDHIIDKIDHDPNTNIVISDIGTNIEANYFFNYFGRQTFLVRVMKKNRDFDNTSNQHYVDDKYTFVTNKSGFRRPNRAIINNTGNYVDVIKNIGYYYNAFFEKGLNYNVKK